MPLHCATIRKLNKFIKKFKNSDYYVICHEHASVKHGLAVTVVVSATIVRCNASIIMDDMLSLCSLQVKKLVYVYLSRYAEEQQDLALLSISTFQRALKVCWTSSYAPFMLCTQDFKFRNKTLMWVAINVLLASWPYLTLTTTDWLKHMFSNMFWNLEAQNKLQAIESLVNTKKSYCSPCPDEEIVIYHILTMRRISLCDSQIPFDTGKSPSQCGACQTERTIECVLLPCMTCNALCKIFLYHKSVWLVQPSYFAFRHRSYQ